MGFEGSMVGVRFDYCLCSRRIVCRFGGTTRNLPFLHPFSLYSFGSYSI